MCIRDSEYGVPRSQVENGSIKLVLAGDKRGELHAIESEYLEPEVHSLMEVKGFVARASDCSRLIFLAPSPRSWRRWWRRGRGRRLVRPGPRRRAGRTAAVRHAGRRSGAHELAVDAGRVAVFHADGALRRALDRALDPVVQPHLLVPRRRAPAHPPHRRQRRGDALGARVAPLARRGLVSGHRAPGRSCRPLPGRHSASPRSAGSAPR